MSALKLNQCPGGLASVADIQEFESYAILAVWDCGTENGCTALDIGADAPAGWMEGVHSDPFYGLYGQDSSGEWQALHDTPSPGRMLQKVRELVRFEDENLLLPLGMSAVKRRKGVIGYDSIRACAVREGYGGDGTPLYYLGKGSGGLPQAANTALGVKPKSQYDWD